MNQWGKDKWKHLLVCIPLGVTLQAGSMHVVPDRPLLAIFLAFSLMVFVAYMFEIFSLITDLGYYEMLDALASILGGILGIGLYVGFKMITG